MQLLQLNFNLLKALIWFSAQRGGVSGNVVRCLVLVPFRSELEKFGESHARTSGRASPENEWGG
jgi:hypothetical protein